MLTIFYFFDVDKKNLIVVPVVVADVFFFVSIRIYLSRCLSSFLLLIYIFFLRRFIPIFFWSFVASSWP